MDEGKLQLYLEEVQQLFVDVTSKGNTSVRYPQSYGKQQSL
jgi:hypothetical protein